MKSPFPGMDPYLERHWGDVHSRLVLYSCDQMQAGLPGDLFARVEERVYVENEGARPRGIFPDVRVVEHGNGISTSTATLAGAAGVAVAEPFVLHLEAEQVTETFIEIREVGEGHRVVTVVEFLSPANKLPGDGNRLYLKKQHELLMGKVNLVEIDLTRTGSTAFGVAPNFIPAHLREAYHVVVRRGRDPYKSEIYPISLRERLPAFRVPLRETDADIVLNLQTLIEQCYANGRYGSINYQVAPDPPLEGADAEWANALLRSVGKRQ